METFLLVPDVPHPSASKQIRAHTVNSATYVLKCIKMNVLYVVNNNKLLQIEYQDIRIQADTALEDTEN